ncbi:MAG: hypothetical protein ACTHNU_05320 [Gaiellales bacterium]
MTTDNRTPPVYTWATSVGFAIVGTAAAVGLIIVFTYLVDVAGDFWSQVIYFLAVFGGIIGLAVRSRRKDSQDPGRLSSGAPITPAGLPGPFVVTQALGVLGIAMIAVGALVGGDRGITWIFGGIVAVLVGGVGLAFWMAGILAARRRT